MGDDSSSSGGELEAGELVIDDSYTHMSKKKKKSKKSKKKKDKEKDRDKEKSGKDKKHSKGFGGGFFHSLVVQQRVCFVLPPQPRCNPFISRLIQGPQPLPPHRHTQRRRPDVRHGHARPPAPPPGQRWSDREEEEERGERSGKAREGKR